MLLINLPERTTISCAVKPLFEKADMISLRSIRGDGISLVTASLLAVVESLLPSPTVHDGPPNWWWNNENVKMLILQIKSLIKKI